MSQKTQPAKTMTSAEYLRMMRERRNAPQENQPDPKQTPDPSTSTAATTNKSTQNKDEAEEQLFPGVPKPRPKRSIFSWTAPSRPFKKRDRQYYTTVTAIIFLVSLILFFAGQFLPIAVVISVGFLAYVLSSVPPHQVKIDINTYGIEIEETLYYWQEMGRFWFDQKFDQEILLIEIVRFPGRITILVNKEQQKELREILNEVLIEEKPADTFYDKAAAWIQEKVPLEVGS